MIGRKPTPTRLKELAGNPGKRALNPAEPEGKSHSGAVPRWLEGAGPRRVWRRLGPSLARARVLTDLDVEALAALCCAVADYHDARKHPSVETVEACALALLEMPEEGGRRRETAFELIRALLARSKGSTGQYRAVVAGLAEFGLSPSSRSRVRLPPAKEDDPLELFLSGRGAA